MLFNYLTVLFLLDLVISYTFTFLSYVSIVKRCTHNAPRADVVVHLSTRLSVPDTNIENGGGLAADQTDCSMPCSGNSEEICGAGDRLSVYPSVGAPAVDKKDT